MKKLILSLFLILLFLSCSENSSNLVDETSINQIKFQEISVIIGNITILEKYYSSEIHSGIGKTSSGMRDKFINDRIDFSQPDSVIINKEKKSCKAQKYVDHGWGLDVHDAYECFVKFTDDYKLIDTIRVSKENYLEDYPSDYHKNRQTFLLLVVLVDVPYTINNDYSLSINVSNTDTNLYVTAIKYRDTGYSYLYMEGGHSYENSHNYSGDSIKNWNIDCLVKIMIK